MQVVDRSGGARAELVVLAGLAVILGLEILGWHAAHQTERQLRESLAAGSPRQKAWALHVLLNRGESPAIDRAGIEALLSSEEGLLREMAMTSDVWRLGGREPQTRHLERHADRGESVRGRYYLKHLGQPIGRSALRRYFRSLEVEPDGAH